MVVFLKIVSCVASSVVFDQEQVWTSSRPRRPWCRQSVPSRRLLPVSAASTSTRPPQNSASSGTHLQPLDDDPAAAVHDNLHARAGRRGGQVGRRRAHAGRHADGTAVAGSSGAGRRAPCTAAAGTPGRSSGCLLPSAAAVGTSSHGGGAALRSRRHVRHVQEVDGCDDSDGDDDDDEDDEVEHEQGTRPSSAPSTGDNDFSGPDGEEEAEGRLDVDANVAAEGDCSEGAAELSFACGDNEYDAALEEVFSDSSSDNEVLKIHNFSAPSEEPKIAEACLLCWWGSISIERMIKHRMFLPYVTSTVGSHLLLLGFRGRHMITKCCTRRSSSFGATFHIHPKVSST
ncbi:uncharacterized protein LOC120689226 [Panicum virgatum]|uniref:uncharacterized protein LOC120689226 n=1 Tax=Panicum virgatum TaxID=38727 RepID=UPI0019D631F7|nr:uncharacterized protein LOC120689226 [Panicum virgatum]